MSYVLRRLWYVARRVLYLVYRLLHFFAKPGSRLLVPIAAAAGAFYARAPLHQIVAEEYRAFSFLPLEPPWPDMVLVAAWIVFTVLYYVLSRVLEVILGTFPMMAHPLPPQRPIKAARKKEIGRAVVRMVVPALPRRRHVQVAPAAVALPLPSPKPAALVAPAIAPAVVQMAVPPLARRPVITGVQAAE
jgi:hypothetical protein